MKVNQLGNHVYAVTNYLNSDAVDVFLETHDYKNEGKYSQAGVYGGKHGDTTGIDTTSRLTSLINCGYDVNLEVNRKLSFAVTFINERYLQRDVRNYCIPTQLLKYHITDEGGGFFRKHKDSSKLSYRVITGIVILSDPSQYTGCKLRFFDSVDDKQGYSVEQKKGTILVFPSETWHAIDPLTSGERYSLVTWYKKPGGDPNEPI